MRRMLQISWTAKKSNETVLREADRTISLINRIRKHLANFFVHIMYEKRETRTSCDNWNDRRKKGNRRKQRDKMLDEPNKVAQSRTSVRRKQRDKMLDEPNKVAQSRTSVRRKQRDKMLDEPNKVAQSRTSVRRKQRDKMLDEPNKVAQSRTSVRSTESDEE